MELLKKLKNGEEWIFVTVEMSRLRKAHPKGSFNMDKTLALQVA
jgi:hypothetical protein